MLTFGNEHRSDTILFIANETGTDSMRWYEGIKIFYILSGTAHIHVEKERSHADRRRFSGGECL